MPQSVQSVWWPCTEGIKPAVITDNASAASEGRPLVQSLGAEFKRNLPLQPSDFWHALFFQAESFLMIIFDGHKTFSSVALCRKKMLLKPKCCSHLRAFLGPSKTIDVSRQGWFIGLKSNIKQDMKWKGSRGMLKFSCTSFAPLVVWCFTRLESF